MQSMVFSEFQYEKMYTSYHLFGSFQHIIIMNKCTCGSVGKAQLFSLRTITCCQVSGVGWSKLTTIFDVLASAHYYSLIHTGISISSMLKIFPFLKCLHFGRCDYFMMQSYYEYRKFSNGKNPSFSWFSFCGQFHVTKLATALLCDVRSWYSLKLFTFFLFQIYQRSSSRILLFW